jgi:hypothetical protein
LACVYVFLRYSCLGDGLVCLVGFSQLVDQGAIRQVSSATLLA